MAGAGGDSGSGGGGSGGHSGTGGDSGSGGAGGDGGSGGDSGASGSGGAGGSAGSAAGGGAGSGGSTTSGGSSGFGGGPADAGPDACTLVTWFQDDDKDGAGRTNASVESCDRPAPEGWAEVGGDCNDDNKTVTPDQTDYFGVPYLTAGNTQSFDYNCKNGEEPDDSQYGAAPTCPITTIGCSGTGYVPTARTGPGVNSLCGSTTLRTCQTDAILGCKAVVTTVAPKRCR